MTDKLNKLETQLAALEANPQAKGQAKIDTLNSLAWELRQSDVQGGLALSQTAYQLVTNLESPYQAGLAYCLRNLGRFNYYLANFELSLTQSFEALALFEAMDDWAGQASVLHTIGKVYWDLGNYSEALDYCLKELEVAQITGNKRDQADALNAIGVLYGDIGDKSQAIDSYHQAIQLYQQLNDKYGQAWILNNRAMEYLSLGIYSNALADARESLQLTQENNFDELAAYILGTMGEIYLTQADYDQALDYFKQELDRATQMGDKSNQVTALLGIGQVYCRQKQRDIACSTLQQALSLAETINTKLAICQCHQALAEFYKAQGNFETALAHHEQFHKLEKEIFNEQTGKKFKSLQVIHQTETARKEAEIYELKSLELERQIIERKQAEAEAKRRADEMSTLAEISREISSTLDLQTVLERIAQRAKGLLHAVDLVLCLRQADGETFTVAVALSDYPDEFKNFSFRLGQGIIGHVAKTGRAEIVNVPSQHPNRVHLTGAWDETVGSDDDLYPMLVVPLITRGVVIGVITLWRYIEHGLFTATDLSFLSGLAQQTAIAIENARLFEQAQQQLKVAESLREVAYILSSSLDQSSVISRILEQLRQVVVYYGAGIFLQEDDDLVLIASNSIHHSLIGTRLSISSQDPAVRVFRQKNSLIINDVHQDPGWHIWPGAYLIHSWMGAPLFVGNKVIGVLTADHHKLAAYTQENSRILQTFANQAAMAIENARLFKELQQANQELSKLNADKDRFLSIVAHDLRAPFMPVLGAAELLLDIDGTFEANQVKELSELIYLSSRKVFDLLENLLQWSRIQMGRMPYTPTQLNLTGMIENNVDLFAQNAALKQITLHHCLNQPLWVYADENMLDTIIRNLTSNALKFTPNGGTITLTAYPTGDEWVQIEVRDTGVGLSREDLDKLFQLDTPHSTPGTDSEKGTGLGLAICQEMVAQQGGQLWLESEPGHGTTVKFTLPYPLNGADIQESDSPRRDDTENENSPSP